MAEDILSVARAHFAAFKGGTIEVAEWGAPGAPLVIHHRPLSLRARQALELRAKGNQARQLALTVILHARDAEGKLLFTDDVEALAALENQVDPAVVARIALRILGVTPAADLGN